MVFVNKMAFIRKMTQWTQNKQEQVMINDCILLIWFNLLQENKYYISEKFYLKYYGNQNVINTVDDQISLNNYK